MQNLTEPKSDHAALTRRARSIESATTGAGLRKGVLLPVLREAIVDGELEPGARLSEADLARALGVSRTPIRETLAVLEREGLVVVVPHMGAFVRTVTESDVDEIYVVREALEVLATQLAVARISAVGIARIDESVAIMQAAVERNDPRAYVEELDHFYGLLMQLSGNATLEWLHERLLGPVRRLRRISMSYEGRMARSFAQLKKIATAIAARDPIAGELMREQIARARETVMEVARQTNAATFDDTLGR